MNACWKCGKALTDLPKRISFREICPFCHACLHACMNCKNYSVGRANDCKIPGTDLVSDREAGNFCEDFLILEESSILKQPSQDPLKKLFGD